ncbi:MAG: hypothetical protein FWF37_05090 [Chloroflexi bacterium]|nr:hypothetical protein [Chloroflexota bacterium]
MFLYIIITSLIAAVLIIAALLLTAFTRSTANNNPSPLNRQNLDNSSFEQDTSYIVDDGYADYHNLAITRYCTNCGSPTTDNRDIFCVNCGSTLQNI